MPSGPQRQFYMGSAGPVVAALAILRKGDLPRHSAAAPGTALTSEPCSWTLYIAMVSALAFIDRRLTDCCGSGDSARQSELAGTTALSLRTGKIRLAYYRLRKYCRVSELARNHHQKV